MTGSIPGAVVLVTGMLPLPLDQLRPKQALLPCWCSCCCSCPTHLSVNIDFVEGMAYAALMLDAKQPDTRQQSHQGVGGR